MPLPVIPDPLVQVALPTGATVGLTDSGGEGPVVVCSHGLLMNHAMFAPQVEALRDAYRVVTWDERGHGEAEHEGTWTYWDSADDLIAILDHLGVDTAVLVGMSQGGYLSLRAALRYPDRVRALVLLDTQAGTEDPVLLPEYTVMSDAWAERGPDPVTMGYVADAILGPDADQEAWKERWVSMPWHRAPQVMHPLVERADISDRLAQIQAPALVIHGELDAAISLDRAEALAAGLPGAQPLVVVPGAGHAANLTHPAPVNAAIRPFLDSLSGS
ncbi:MAG: alpha/beta hydrolase [Frankiales bacterium]|nr:alpha/beta hydrolase [Frankiales bacterium]